MNNPIVEIMAAAPNLPGNRYHRDRKSKYASRASRMNAPYAATATCSPTLDCWLLGLKVALRLLTLDNISAITKRAPAMCRTLKI